jgi:hypothetical protein
MQDRYEEDFKKREKITILEYSGVSKDLFPYSLCGDYISYEKLIDYFEQGKKEAQEKFTKFESGHVGILINGLNDKEPYIEYHIGREETNEEFNKRIKYLDNKPKIKRENDIRKLKELAEKYNYKIIEK